MSHLLWQSICASADVELTASQRSLLDAYLDLLSRWNQRLNLTRIVDRESASVRHIADSLTLLRFIPKNAKTLVDVGTGGGVPGVPLAIARPDLRLMLVDSTKKKLDAIDTIVGSIALPNVQTFHARIETIQQTFDVVTARAVAELKTLVQWCAPLMHDKSVLITPKGPRAADELAAAQSTLVRLKLNASLHDLNIEQLPGHVVLTIRRVD